MSFISILQGGKAAKKLGEYNNSLYQRDAAIQRQEKIMPGSFMKLSNNQNLQKHQRKLEIS